SSPLQPDRYGQVQQQRAVRLQIAVNSLRKRLDQGEIDSAAVTLIRASGIGESIANDRLPLREGGTNEVLHMNASGCEHQQGLCGRAQRLLAVGERDVTNALSQWCTPGLSRQTRWNSSLCEPLAYPTPHGRLAGPFDAL